MKRWLEAGTLASRCHGWITGPQCAYIKLDKAIGFHTANTPAINLLEFHEQGLWIAFCQWTDVFFRGGKCLWLQQSLFYMSLEKGHRSYGIKWDLWVNIFTFVTTLGLNSDAVVFRRLILYLGSSLILEVTGVKNWCLLFVLCARYCPRHFIIVSSNSTVDLQSELLPLCSK